MAESLNGKKVYLTRLRKRSMETTDAVISEHEENTCENVINRPEDDRPSPIEGILNHISLNEIYYSKNCNSGIL